MLDAKALDLDRIFSAEVLWAVLPKWLPGRVKRYLSQYPGERGFIEVLAPVRYPNNQLMGEVYCRELDGLEIGALVLFDLGPASSFEREKKGQPNLMEAGSVEIASEAEVASIKQQIANLKLAQLGQSLEQRIRDLEQARANVDAAVEERVRDERAKLAQKATEIEAHEQRIDQREADLEQEVQHRTGVAVEKRLLEIDMRERAVTAREEGVAQREAKVKERSGELEGQRQELAREWSEFREQGGERFLSFWASIQSPEAGDSTPDPLVDSAPPRDLPGRLCREFAESGYVVDEPLVIQALLSIVVAASTGQFIILTGPTGVGKTSMASLMATALGAGRDVVPVRPAWIDPSDLLGFFNPQQNQFQPTPFIDRVVDAQRWTAVNRLYLLTLDEMNLSRVENYAADFLSRLEKARAGEQDARLTLCATEIEERLRAELQELWRLEPLNGVGRQRMATLLRHRDRYPSRLDIPRGLVMLGTINLDETTYAFSPKFLDRSLIVQISHAPLPESITDGKAGALFAKEVWGLSLATAQSLADPSAKLPSKANQIWDDVRQWQTSFLAPLGVRLGFRFPQNFQRYMLAAQRLGLKDPYPVAATFFQAKLLPWVSFHKDDRAIGLDESKLEVLSRWCGHQSLSSYPGMQSSIQRMIDRGTMVVQYLE